MDKLKTYGYYCFIILPVIVFYWLFFKFTVNAPINDDYQAILDFINKVITTDSYTEKIKLIFSQHNEHRIVYDRIWTIISYKLQKNVDFNFLSLIGNLSLLGIAIIFFKRFVLLQKHVLLFFPITIFIFNLSLWENMTFAMAALSNFTVYLFILISLGFVTSNTLDKKINLYLSLLFFFLATITQGGGLFILPVSLLILLYKREYYNFLIYVLFSVALLVIYFCDYQKPAQNLDLLTSIVQSKQDIIYFAFAFLGNAFNYYLIYTNNVENSILFTTIIGSIFFLLFAYITYTKYYKKNLFIYSIMLVIIISSFITAISRISFGLETAGASRYRINGVIFFIALYFWFIETRNFKKIIYVYLVSALSIVYYICINISQYQYLYIREKQTYSGILNYKSGNSGLLNGDKSLINLYNEIIKESEKLNTYKFPDNKELERYFPYSDQTIINKKETEDLTVLTNNTETINKVSDSYFIEGWAFLEDENTKTQKVYIGIKNINDNQPTYYLANSTKRYDLGVFFKKSYLDDGGYILRIQDSLIGNGENFISIMLMNGNKIKKVETDKQIKK
jgi:hypothetical protein